MLVISILLFAILVILIIIMWRQVAGPEKFANHGRLIQSGKSRAVVAFSRIRFAERAKLSLKAAAIASIAMYLVTACGLALERGPIETGFLAYMIIWVTFVGLPLAFVVIWLVVLSADFTTNYRKAKSGELLSDSGTERPLSLWNKKGGVFILATIGFFIAFGLALALSD